MQRESEPQREPESNTPDPREAEQFVAAHIPEEAPDDIAERPGSTHIDPKHADELADEWGEESFPGSDPPAHY